MTKTCPSFNSTSVAPRPAREWTYAGVALFTLTAIVAHHAHGDPIAFNIVNLALMGLLVISYVQFSV